MIRQVTFVALYGDKPHDFQDVVLECQQQIAHHLGDAFKPYTLWQIHATMLGLERVNEFTYENRNFFQFRGESKTMDLAGFFNWIRSHSGIPFQIQIGGFEDREYPFVSRGQKPYDRSFAIQGDKVVFMGWSIASRTLHENLGKLPTTPTSLQYPTTLEDLRRSAQSFNILYNYHRQPSDIDNDFYLRLGLIDSHTLEPQIFTTLENTLRQFLSQIPPLILEITHSQLYIAAYTDDRLPQHSTHFWTIEDPVLTPSCLKQLYTT